MADRMIEINGRTISESTIVEALEKSGIKVEEPKHPCQSGDVVQTEYGIYTVIVQHIGGILHSYRIADGLLQGQGKKAFERCRYKKICTLQELFACWKKYHPET